MLDVLEQRYSLDPDLQRLGSLLELKSYLTDEIEQAQTQGFDLDSVEADDENPFNVLYHYLRGVAPVPDTLHHSWIEGDYPDIDADFSPRGREAIRAYLEAVYGKGRIMSVATFSNANVRGGMQDIGEGLGYDRREIVQVCKAFDNVPPDKELDETSEELDWLQEESDHAAELFAESPMYKEWVVKYGELIRSVGQHAAALVVSSDPITEYLPVMRSKNNAHMIALNKEELQPQGAIKYDFLGLTNIDILAWAMRFIKERHGIEMDEKFWFDLGFDHPDIYQLACRGELEGVFQLEGPAGRQCVAKVQPKSFDDLTFINAGMRPGASAAGAPEVYHKHANGQKDADYPDVEQLAQYGVSDKFLRIMRRTYGVVAYQEQIMLFLHYVGGIDLPGTNKVRKVITKPPEKRTEKHTQILEDAQAKYMKNCASIGMPEDLATKWWETVVGQAGYSFNFAHCLEYSLISFRELYIKAKYTTEFFGALIQVAENLKDSKLLAYISAARRMGVEVLPPDVNQSLVTVKLEGQNVRLGFDKLKYVSGAAGPVIVERQPYKSLDDYIQKTLKSPAGHKRVMEALILSGAFDAIEGVEEAEMRQALLDRFYESKRTKHENRIRLDTMGFLESERDYAGYAFSISGLIEDRPNGIYPLEELVALPAFDSVYTVVFVEAFGEKKIKSGRNEGKYFMWVKMHNFRIDNIVAYMWSKELERFDEAVKDQTNNKMMHLTEGCRILISLAKKGDGRYHLLAIHHVVDGAPF